MKPKNANKNILLYESILASAVASARLENVIIPYETAQKVLQKVLATPQKSV